MTDGIFGTILIICSVCFDVVANVFLKKSQGFKRKLYGLSAICCVGIAFLFLAKAITVMDLSIAYSLFGAFGLLITTFVDKTFFNLKVTLLGIAGIIMMISGIVLIKMI